MCSAGYVDDPDLSRTDSSGDGELGVPGEHVVNGEVVGNLRDDVVGDAGDGRRPQISRRSRSSTSRVSAVTSTWPRRCVHSPVWVQV